MDSICNFDTNYKYEETSIIGHFSASCCIVSTTYPSCVAVLEHLRRGGLYIKKDQDEKRGLATASALCLRGV